MISKFFFGNIADPFSAIIVFPSSKILIFEVSKMNSWANKRLLKLINKKNNIVLREELAEQDYDETELRKVDVQITRLRQKIESNPKQPHFIKTIRGKGYKLVCNEIWYIKTLFI